MSKPKFYQLEVVERNYGVPNASSSARRKILFAAVGSVLYEAGFHSAHRAAIETLTEMLQSCIWEIARSSRAFCELAGRTDVVIGDVQVALIEMGLSVDSLSTYAQRSNRITFEDPGVFSRSMQSTILHAGERRSLPNYITSDNNFPPFPDPHAYIRTPTHKQPITDYEVIREKAALQKRDIERALTRYMAKTNPTHSLYPDDNTLFPLIACKPSNGLTYLNALLYSDMQFDLDEKGKSPVSTSKTYGENENAPKYGNQDAEVVDNPYLRAAKLQRKRRK